MTLKLTSVFTFFLVALALSQVSLHANGLPAPSTAVLHSRASHLPLPQGPYRRSPINVGKAMKDGANAGKEAAQKGVEQGKEGANQGVEETKQRTEEQINKAVDKGADEMKKKAKEELMKKLAAALIPSLYVLGLLSLIGAYLCVRRRTIKGGHKDVKLRRCCRWLPWIAWDQKRKTRCDAEADLTKSYTRGHTPSHAVSSEK